jgi:hypothetical protein
LHMARTGHPFRAAHRVSSGEGIQADACKHRRAGSKGSAPFALDLGFCEEKASPDAGEYDS